MPEYDVVIVGAGPVGGALALALRTAGLQLALLDTRQAAAPHDDPRPLALSHGTRLILERLDLWQSLAPVTPITRIHVSQRGGFGRVEFDAAARGWPALGYVLDYSNLAAITAHTLRGGWCDYLTGATVTSVRLEAAAARVEFEVNGIAHQCGARLLVVADGGAGLEAAGTRTVDYRQTAVTARVSSTVPHHNVAYERFTPEGPLALLPAGDELALIWAMAPERAQRLCAAPDPAFLAELEHAFGGRLGRYTAVTRRAAFPLVLKVAREVVAARTVRIGNAAQTLHPVAGQGLNLGLRDAWELAAGLQHCRHEDVGAPPFLQSYAARRRLDRHGGIGFTHNLVRIFSSDLAPVRLARGLGLAALAAVPPAQDFLERRMVFGARG